MRSMKPLPTDPPKRRPDLTCTQLCKARVVWRTCTVCQTRWSLGSSGSCRESDAGHQQRACSASWHFLGQPPSQQQTTVQAVPCPKLLPQLVAVAEAPLKHAAALKGRQEDRGDHRHVIILQGGRQGKSQGLPGRPSSQLRVCRKWTRHEQGHPGRTCEGLPLPLEGAVRRGGGCAGG
jgi:hypothetical protein